MKITKLGHCCLLIETKEKRILTDPGAFSVASHKDVNNIDIILITHEHADHLHTESLQEILSNNPEAKVFTNTSVNKLLQELAINSEILEGRETLESHGILLEAFDAKHEEIFEEIGQVQNTGYFIDNKLFYPGDAFCNPEKPVDILALPVAGPWCRVTDAINYALLIKPRAAFPVHDGMLQEDKIGGSHAIPEKVLTENGIEFVRMVEDGVLEG